MLFAIGTLKKPFQSTLPRRERPISMYITPPITAFQSTLPRRERPCKEAGCGCFEYFNPRSREGSDLTCNGQILCSQHFNPRSREGSDQKGLTMVRITKISIHAPAKGATRFC